MSDIATALSLCILSDGTQTATAVIPFAQGLSVSGGSSLTTYSTGTTSTTCTWNGTGSPGTSASITVTWQKVGNFVTLNIPLVTATTGTNSTTLASNTAIAAAARPAVAHQCPITNILNYGAAVDSAGVITITTGGLIQIIRDAAGNTFTNSGSAGTNGDITVTYFSA